MKFVLILLAGAMVMCGVCVYKLFKHGNPMSPVPVATSPGKVTSAGGSETGNKRVRVVNEPLYTVYRETFKGAVLSKGVAMLHTDGGWYQAGEMSGKGYVTAVSDRRAKLSLPDGRLGWVVAEDEMAVPAPVVKGESEKKKETAESVDSGPVYMSRSQDEWKSVTYPDLAVAQQKRMTVSGSDSSVTSATAPVVKKTVVVSGTMAKK